MSSGLSRLLHTGTRWAAMDLRSVVGRLEAISPSSRAESWDNVGLLVEPSGNPSVQRIMLTTDLTETVMDEAESLGAGLIVSYHPPIFHPLKRLTQNTAKEKIIVRALELKVAVYSPHTALDSIEGGVNDWLLQGLGEGKVQALKVNMLSPYPSKLLTICGLAGEAAAEETVAGLTQRRGVTIKPSQSDPSLCDLEVPCTDAEVASLLLHLHTTAPNTHLSLQPRPQVPVAGGGRLLTLTEPVTLSQLVSRVKVHLSLPYVRVACPTGWVEEATLSTIAVCAGSGGQVLKDVDATVYLTGEMSHHDVLAATARGVVVILCEHSNTERGFLQSYMSLLQASLGPAVAVTLSERDADPLTVV